MFVLMEHLKQCLLFLLANVIIIVHLIGHSQYMQQ